MHLDFHAPEVKKFFFFNFGKKIFFSNNIKTTIFLIFSLKNVFFFKEKLLAKKTTFCAHKSFTLIEMLIFSKLFI